jgi:hypothetical protein
MIDHEIKDALNVEPSPEFLARVRGRIASEPAPSAWRWSWTVFAAVTAAAALAIAGLVSRPVQKAVRPSEIAQAFRSEAQAGPKGPALHQTEPMPSAPSERRPGPSASARLEAPRAPARLAEAPETRRRFGPGDRRSAKAAPPATPGAAAHATPVVSGFPPPLQSSSAELRRGQAEAQSAKAGSRTVTREAEVLLDPSETRALRALIAGLRDGRIDLAAAQRSSSPAPMDLEPVTDIVIAPITIEPIAPPSGAEGARP